MDDGRIELVIEGLPEKDGKVLLGTLMSKIQSLSAILNRLDRDAGDGKSGSAFEVVAMSYASPYRIAVEPRPIPNAEFTGRLVMAALGDVSAALASNESLDQFDSDVLEPIRALARPVGKAVKNVSLRIGDTIVELNSRIVARIDEALATEDECEGFIEGMLEQINLHGGANTFHIYPQVGPKKVSCHFPLTLIDDAIAAVGRRVEVTGTLKYRANASFPHEIAVTAVEAYPPDADLADWEDLCGRAPDATGELSSEAFIREQRDAWI
jgi:hypothetical protein